MLVRTGIRNPDKLLMRSLKIWLRMYLDGDLERSQLIDILISLLERFRIYVNGCIFTKLAGGVDIEIILLDNDRIDIVFERGKHGLYISFIRLDFPRNTVEISIDTRRFLINQRISFEVRQ